MTAGCRDILKGLPTIWYKKLDTGAKVYLYVTTQVELEKKDDRRKRRRGEVEVEALDAREEVRIEIR